MKKNRLLALLVTMILVTSSCEEKNPLNQKTKKLETGTMTDCDGNVYRTVKIGDQWWMAENLRVTRYRNGDTIPNITGNNQWKGLTTGGLCYYNNDSNYAEEFGALYNWYAVTSDKKLAPDGWHVPGDEEWKQLERTLGMSETDVEASGLRGAGEGGKVKSAGFGYWASPNTGATNSSGFSARAAGYRNFNDGAFYLIGQAAIIWSATELNSDYAWYRELSCTNANINRYIFYNKRSGLSVRLVMD
ncbi:MAG TPA: fibrobacter succinogenes major paralogous domain-containing protein [bacterium]|mgnify:CR=1 FL=1|nr:fibrobacter succinogenes major paralogous domain-containing protein [bacterium]HPN42891.1 fibrobacter succinogenes major paralogous domain-containing protein [bacterium]